VPVPSSPVTLQIISPSSGADVVVAVDEADATGVGVTAEPVGDEQPLKVSAPTARTVTADALPSE
jgi:hypothetical protein